ncbi:MAG: MFS transporter, partial [Candidatus Dormibacteraeota bacterium]|nr:MFS transporter [Candidatus Dormibacteraeota bacterium]
MSAENVIVSGRTMPGEPRVSNLWHLALSAFWFGNFFLWQPLTTVVIQGQVDALVPKAQQNTGIGIAIGIGGFFAMVVPPLVGAFSDRLSTRWGRRRPIMVAGTLLALPGLAIMAGAGNLVQLVLGYAVLQFFFAAAGAAFAGIIPDVVPEREFGKASGFLAAMVLVGSAAG